MEQVKQVYEHAVIATDVVIFTMKDDVLQVLLIKMTKSEYEDHWALPGGLVEGDEGLEESAHRHLEVKTGVKEDYLEQLETFGAPDRDPFGRVVSVAYFALVPQDKHELSTSEEYDGVEWFPVGDLPKLAYDHELMLATAVARLKAKLEYTNIAYGLLPHSFTLTDLQTVYEVILGKDIDKRNFRKKILASGILKETKEIRSDGAYRPAKLYAFTSESPQVVEML